MDGSWEEKDVLLLLLLRWANLCSNYFPGRAAEGRIKQDPKKGEK